MANWFSCSCNRWKCLSTLFGVLLPPLLCWGMHGAFGSRSTVARPLSVLMFWTGAHNSAASSRLNWHPPPHRQFKWTRPFRWIWFLRVCHHIFNVLYLRTQFFRSDIICRLTRSGKFNSLSNILLYWIHHIQSGADYRDYAFHISYWDCRQGVQKTV